MRKGFILIAVGFIILTLINIAGVSAKDESVQLKKTTKTSFEKDVTGDRQPDKITIKPSSTKPKQQVEIELSSSEKNKYIIPINGKKEPEIYFLDFNRDRVTDLLIADLNKNSGRDQKFRLFTFNNGNLKRHILPEELSIGAQFENHYKASIRINKTGDIFSLNLRERKRNYDQKGLYVNGLLNEPTELMVQTFEHFKPVRFKDFSFGLKGRQAITEEYDEERIAAVDSFWKWKHGKWELVKMIVKKSPAN